MFQSLSKRTQCHHLQLHKLITDFEEQNLNIIDSLSKEEAQLHLKMVSQDTVWGSASELIAVTSMLQIPVYTFTKSSSQTYSWHKYSSLQLQWLCFRHNPALKVVATRLDLPRPVITSNYHTLVAVIMTGSFQRLTSHLLYLDL